MGIRKSIKNLFKNDLEDRIKVLELKVSELEGKLDSVSKSAPSGRRFG